MFSVVVDVVDVVVVGGGDRGDRGDSRRRSFVCLLLHLSFFGIPRALVHGVTCRVFIRKWGRTGREERLEVRG